MADWTLPGFSSDKHFNYQTPVDASDTNNQTALHIAAIHGQTFMADWLVHQCPSLLSMRDCNGHTPWRLAAQHGHLNLTYTLLRNDPSQL